MRKSALDWIVGILVILGAISWGLIGAFDWNLLSIFGTGGWLLTIIHILIGLSGLYMIYQLFK